MHPVSLTKKQNQNDVHDVYMRTNTWTGRTAENEEASTKGWPPLLGNPRLRATSTPTANTSHRTTVADGVTFWRPFWNRSAATDVVPSWSSFLCAPARVSHRVLLGIVDVVTHT